MQAASSKEISENGCIQASTEHNSPAPVRTVEGCSGSRFDVCLCVCECVCGCEKYHCLLRSVLSCPAVKFVSWNSSSLQLYHPPQTTSRLFSFVTPPVFQSVQKTSPPHLYTFCSIIFATKKSSHIFGLNTTLNRPHFSSQRIEHKTDHWVNGTLYCFLSKASRLRTNW